jgi:hypothetical protein
MQQSPTKNKQNIDLQLLLSASDGNYVSMRFDSLCDLAPPRVTWVF